MRHALFTILPKWLMSRSVRRLAATRLPRFLRDPLYRGFARATGADLRDIEGAPADYPSLAAFFGRTLRKGARPIDAIAPLVWPCDGTLCSAGPIENGTLEQVKGRTYTVADLLGGDEAEARSFAAGTQATIYLAPRDYHRVHAPFDARLIEARPLPGGLYPVNPKMARVRPRLFVRNERCVFRFELEDGRPAALVMIAALNVSDIRTSVRGGSDVERGQELGVFGLGSTVVALLPSGRPTFPTLPGGTIVQMGGAVPI